VTNSDELEAMLDRMRNLGSHLDEMVIEAQHVCLNITAAPRPTDDLRPESDPADAHLQTRETPRLPWTRIGRYRPRARSRLSCFAGCV